jgi:hypothetical protein
MLSLFLESHGKHKFPEEDEAESGMPKTGTCGGGRQVPFKFKTDQGGGSCSGGRIPLNLGKKTDEGIVFDQDTLRNNRGGSCGSGRPADTFESEKKQKKKKSTKKKTKSKKIDKDAKADNQEKVKTSHESQESNAQANEINKNTQPKSESPKETKDEL